MEDAKAIPFNPLVELFLDGVKANLPQSKYLLWFSLVEKYVENNQRTFNSFHSLYADHDEKAVRDLADKLDSPKKRDVLLGIFSGTEETRAEKLHRKLIGLSITSIDVQVCRKLIQYRNELAHTGKPPDKTLLYDELLPLCRKLVEISPSLSGDLH